MHPQRANIPLQGLDRRVLTVRGISGPHCQIAALHWCISPVVDLHGRKKHSGEADQLTLTSGGSEHAELFSVAISWGNKINFCLYAYMAGFCSDGHMCKVYSWQ